MLPIHGHAEGGIVPFSVVLQRFHDLHELSCVQYVYRTKTLFLDSSELVSDDTCRGRCAKRRCCFAGLRNVLCEYWTSEPEGCF